MQAVLNFKLLDYYKKEAVKDFKIVFTYKLGPCAYSEGNSSRYICQSLCYSIS